MAEEKNYLMPLVAIVAIVAIVGLVMMFMNKGTATYTTTAAPEVQKAMQIETENMVGEAGFGGSFGGQRCPSESDAGCEHVGQRCWRISEDGVEGGSCRVLWWQGSNYAACACMSGRESI